jgi:hypothetical protein
VVPLKDIRAKDGNLSIPLYVASSNVAQQERASYTAGGLDVALTEWLESSKKVRESLKGVAGGLKGLLSS